MTRLSSVAIGSVLAVVSGAILLTEASAQTRAHVVGQSWLTTPRTDVPRTTHPKGFSRHGGTFSPPGLSRRFDGRTRHHTPGHSRHNRSDGADRGLRILPRLDGGLDRRRGPRRTPPGHMKRN